MCHTRSMAYQFTPAVERALHAASQWSSAGDGDAGTLGPAEVLLGLLQEPECRAAKLLGAHGVDAAAIHDRFPQVTPIAESAAASFAARGLSVDVEGALRDAADRLDESPRSFQFATEHVLLGLTLGGDEVGTWLRERGVTPEAIEADQAQRFGDRSAIAVDIGTIPLEENVTHKIVYDKQDAMPRTLDGDRAALLRIIDAAANRAGEGLRVVEDYVRFVLDDAALMEDLKTMRHDLARVFSFLSPAERLAARDVRHDVGRYVSNEREMTRTDLADVAAANIRRLQESLRSLEEYAKLLDTGVAARCEGLRYRAYEIQQRLFAPGKEPSRRNPHSLHSASLYVLVDGGRSPEDFCPRAARLIEAGVDVIQLRDKSLSDRDLLERARTIAALVSGTPTRFIMNDRPDLAVLSGADGVHVGQEELDVGNVRRIVGRDMLIGVSTHNIEQARQAVADGADYLGVGPTFPSSTKSFDAFPGLEFVKAVAAEIHLPAFAIGGITPANVGEVVQAGLRRVAVSGAISQSADPVAAIDELRRQLASSANPPGSLVE